MEKNVKINRSFDWQGILYIQGMNATITTDSEADFLALIEAGLITVIDLPGHSEEV